ncbi:hypothetical protein ANN_21826 [Periplaneta americana]|uniref:Immunoglobulin I-set domain-containing protein n=1 Tax=Periplaneta americana TaxID=6978 RepID=A0ABQ8S6Q8_PERAM|nr:hypothetical protein ANN_21826 [Periplaneta americana]
MAGLCEGGNEPPGSLKAKYVVKQKSIRILRYSSISGLSSFSPFSQLLRDSLYPKKVTNHCVRPQCLKFAKHSAQGRVYHPSLSGLQGHELSSGGRVTITTEDGVACLVIEHITADDSGKYVVSVENNLGADCHFASVAVEALELFVTDKQHQTLAKTRTRSHLWSNGQRVWPRNQVARRFLSPHNRLPTETVIKYRNEEQSVEYDKSVNGAATVLKMYLNKRAEYDREQTVSAGNYDHSGSSITRDEG